MSSVAQSEGYHTYRYEFTWAETESSRKVVSVGHNNGFGLLLERLRLLSAVTLARGDESPKMRKILRIAARYLTNVPVLWYTDT
jgi:hypothetical protein